jgi:hypothetical protein
MAQLNTDLSENAESESESYVTTNGQLASMSWNKAPIWGAYDQIFIIVWQLRVCWFGVPSLTRGRVCRLQLLLALASPVILGSESLGTCDHILLSQIRDFPFRRLLWLAGSRWRYFTPPPHGILRINYVSPFYNFRANWIEITTSNCSSSFCVYPLQRKRVNFVAAVWFSHKPIRCCGYVPSEPLPSNGLFRLSSVMSQYFDLK